MNRLYDKLSDLIECKSNCLGMKDLQTDEPTELILSKSKMLELGSHKTLRLKEQIDVTSKHQSHQNVLI